MYICIYIYMYIYICRCSCGVASFAEGSGGKASQPRDALGPLPMQLERCCFSLFGLNRNANRWEIHAFKAQKR